MELKKFISSVALLAFAILLFRYFFFWKYITPVLISFTLAYSLKDGYISFFNKIGDMCFNASYLLDCLGALLLQVPLNLFFVKKNGYKYGQNYESISEGTGMNQILGTATAAGVVFRKFIDFLFGKGHCINSVKNK